MSDFSAALGARNAALNAKRVLANSGFLRIYSSTIPLNADASTGSPVLVEYALAATAFAAASGGAIVANTISPATVAISGTPTFWRIYDSTGTTCIWQGLVADSPTPIANRLAVPGVMTAGALSSIRSMTITEPT